jgi:hypothetical protein
MFGRLQLSIATAAAALAVAPVASAALPSPIPSVRAAQVVHIARVIPHAGTTTIHTCSAQRSHAGATERKIVPVACEQPPWVNVLGNQHRQAALAIAALLNG